MRGGGHRRVLLVRRGLLLVRVLLEGLLWSRLLVRVLRSRLRVLGRVWLLRVLGWVWLLLVLRIGLLLWGWLLLVHGSGSFHVAQAGVGPPRGRDLRPRAGPAVRRTRRQVGLWGQDLVSATSAVCWPVSTVTG
ncbi:hypothetical protein [Streptomyces sp. NPDC059008]|uniref:hypothetical protein n=1 Tax=Streptomyces sp. NPDC059008 TaxID=3346693 RepID=UPI00368B64A5